jgi:hypothetical protein
LSALTGSTALNAQVALTQPKKPPVMIRAEHFIE